MASETFTSDGTWTVPAGVTEATFTVIGHEGVYDEPDASGRNMVGGTPGLAGKVVGTLPVSAGDTYNINVASDGREVSDVRGPNADAVSDQVFVGATGGEPGYAEDADTTSNEAGDGGDGGGEQGQDGESIYSTEGDGGEGGTQTSGGTGGDDGGGDGGRMSYGTGNLQPDSNTPAIGGDGGLGYYGGGGGGSTDSIDAVAGGGGGGSNYADSSATSVTHTQGTTESAQVVIEYSVPPTAPTVSIDSHTATSVSISWTDEGQDSYNIYRAQSSGGGTLSNYTQIDSVGGSTFSYTDDDGGTGLENGERYYYVVTGETSSGESSASNEVNETTDLPDPTGFSASEQ